MVTSTWVPTTPTSPGRCRTWSCRRSGSIRPWRSCRKWRWGRPRASADCDARHQRWERRVDLRAASVHHLDNLTNGLRRAVQLRALGVGERYVDNLEQTAGAETGRHTGEHTAHAVLALEKHRAGQYLACVVVDGVDHLRHRGARRVVGTAGLEQVHDFSSAVARALHNSLAPIGG